jgi:predicted Fe-Mo cluster-binding NifX family protein
MVVCVTSTGDSVKSELDPRFGRCAYFAFHDTDTGDVSILENEAVRSGGGAGISSGQLMVEKKVNTVITGNVGPNAMSVLSTAGMDIYRGVQSSIEENLENFKQGKLEKISSTVPPHSGMKSRGGL